MYENNTGGTVIKGNQNQGDRRNRDDIAHRIRVIEEVKYDDSTHEHDAHREGIRDVHRPIKEAGLYFIA